MDPRLQTPAQALRLAIGLMATLAGIDKFFNIFADWGSYLSPVAAQLLPFSTDVFGLVLASHSSQGLRGQLRCSARRTACRL